MLQPSVIHKSWEARLISPLIMDTHYGFDDIEDVLQKVGIGFDNDALDGLEDFYAADNIQQPVTTPSIPTPLQFLQNWLPGLVYIATAPRKIDEILGLSTQGSWEDEEIVQQIVELTGTPVPYGDNSVVPFTDWNQNFEHRTLVRFEQGMRVNKLESARAARVRIDSANQKRQSCMLQLEIQRNALGFYGYNSGNNLTYGFLNEPNLPAYITVATGAVSGSKLWALKTFLEIQADLLTAFQQLRTQSQGLIEPDKMATTLVLPVDAVDYLAKTSDFGISVYDWLKQFYPNCRIVSAPQLNNANGGSNVFYLFADKVMDGYSTDGGDTWMQIVPAKFQTLGVAVQTKGYEEDYVNACAGVLLKRPFAVVRYSGI